MDAGESRFEPFVELWGLEVDGAPIVTQYSRLLPVVYEGAPAMLKLLLHDEERLGSTLMAWWKGRGAAKVLAREGDGLLLERATGSRSLSVMARRGEDDEATRIICSVAAQLHSPAHEPPPSWLHPLSEWFTPLEHAKDAYGDGIRRAAETAQSLLEEPREAVVLHGDLHHGNVLDGGDRGWLAIDPKGLIGERGFDFANIFRNPEHAFGADPARLERQATVVAEATGIERKRILQWVLAFCGLSVVWVYGDREPSESALAMAATDLALTKTAAAALDRMDGSTR